MPGGVVFGSLLFLATLFAGISSSISMLEPIVEAFMDRFNMSRKLNSLVVGITLVTVILNIALGGIG